MSSKNRPTYTKDETVEKRADRHKVESLKNSLYLCVEKIKDDQGFIKDTEIIKNCIAYIDRPYLPRKYCGKSVKKARKLHESLKKFLFRAGLIPNISAERYKYLFHEYTFLDREIKILCSKVKLNEILVVNIPEKHEITVQYKKMTQRFANSTSLDSDEEDEVIQRREVNPELKKAYDAHCKGRKFIQRNIRYLIKLKKKYSNEEELWDDLYKVYLNWYCSKISNRDKFVMINELMHDQNFRTTLALNRAGHNYFLSLDLLKAIVLGEESYHKRFSKIVHTLRGIYHKKSIKNNSHVESVVSKIAVASSDEDSGVVLPISSLTKLTINRNLWNWLSRLYENAVKQGYLTFYDVPNHHNIGPAKYGNIIANLNFSHNFRFYSGRFNLLPKYKARSGKLYQDIKLCIIKKCVEKYLEESDVLRYKSMVDDLKGRLKGLFSTPEFAQELFKFIAGDSLKKVKRKEILTLRFEDSIIQYPDDKVILKVAKKNVYPVDLLNAFLDDGLVSTFLDANDKFLVKSCTDRPFRDWFRGSIGRVFEVDQEISDRILKLIEKRAVSTCDISSTFQDLCFKVMDNLAPALEEEISRSKRSLVKIGAKWRMTAVSGIAKRIKKRLEFILDVDQELLEKIILYVNKNLF